MLFLQSPCSKAYLLFYVKIYFIIHIIMQIRNTY